MRSYLSAGPPRGSGRGIPGTWRRLVRLVLLALAGGALLSLLLFPASASQGPETDPSRGISAGQSDSLPVLTFCYQGHPPDTRLVVVDKSLQRLMVFNYLGRMVLEYEFPAMTGSRPGSKLREGDERTPVGIYFTTHRHLDRKVTIFGDRAIHLNYPNPLDQKEGRKGNGIYLHGTNQRYKKRSTNGCVALRNQDMAGLSRLIADQRTPVVVVESLRLPGRREREQACNWLMQLEPLVERPLNTTLGNSLSVMPVTGKLPPKVDSSGVDLAALGGQSPRLKIHTRGLLLMGLGDQWVLVADQRLVGPGHKRVNLTRRIYLKGKNPLKAELVQVQWVVPNLRAARRLLAWAPKRTAPVVASATPKPAGPTPEQQVRAMVSGWLKAWQSKNLRRYMRYYARDFRSQKMGRSAWRRHKAYLNRVYKTIRVKAKDLKIKVKGNQALVSFIQHYRSDWHRDLGRKELRLVYRKGRWQIKSEIWRPLSRRPGQGDGAAAAANSDGETS